MIETLNERYPLAFAAQWNMYVRFDFQTVRFLFVSQHIDSLFPSLYYLLTHFSCLLIGNPSIWISSAFYSCAKQWKILHGFNRIWISLLDIWCRSGLFFIGNYLLWSLSIASSVSRSLSEALKSIQSQYKLKKKNLP